MLESSGSLNSCGGSGINDKDNPQIEDEDLCNG